MGHPTGDHPGGHEPHLAHHFDAPAQQFDASKLGMWLFVATELLMFGGLFTIYAVFRGKYPEVFEFGARHLDTTWGFLNTLVLITSSFTMAMAVRAAQCNQRRQLVLFLTLTLICGVDFLAVKYIEYSHKFEEHLVWGTGFYEGEHGEGDVKVVELRPGDRALGRGLWKITCAPCHGLTGEGLEKLGPKLQQNEFVASLDDTGLRGFLSVGRAATDPRNKTGLLMPARGGNPLLSDQDLVDIIAHVRILGTEAALVDEAPAAGIDDTASELWTIAGEDESGLLPVSVIPVAPVGPVGLAGAESIRVDVPANAHVFFAVYFAMTGLHGLHVLVGLVVIFWLRARAVRGEFGSDYYTPVDIVGLYWHVVDIIWIFLFPLLYLI